MGPQQSAPKSGGSATLWPGSPTPMVARRHAVTGAAANGRERGAAMLPMLLIMAFPILGLLLFLVLPPGMAVPLYVVGLVLSGITHRLMIKAQRLPVQTGPEGMIGAIATVLSWHDATGHVRCHGELWTARTRDHHELNPGTEVQVLGVERDEDMVLIVGSPQHGTSAPG